MLQHQVGAQHSQYFLVSVRRLPFHRDYIVTATIISSARPLLYAITRAMPLTRAFFFFINKNKVHIVPAGTTRLVRSLDIGSVLTMKLFFQVAFRFSHLTFASLDDYCHSVDSLLRPTVQCSSCLLLFPNPNCSHCFPIMYVIIT